MLKIVRFLLVLVAVSLVSCASFPKPTNGSDTLVIGSLIVDFPDGFYGGSARTIDTPITLEIKNISTSEVFQVITKPGGYFYFLTNGKDNFTLDGCLYTASIFSGTYNGGASINPPYKFTVDSGCVQYIGHFKLTEADMHSAANSENGKMYWSSKLSWSLDNKKSEAKEYLQDNAEGTPWLTYEMHPAGE